MSTANQPLPAQLHRAWWLLLGATALLVFLALLPPFIDGHARALLMAAFSPLCHQLPERTVHVAGIPFAACSRCVGIYVGLFGGLAVYPFLRSRSLLRMLVNRHAAAVLLIALAVPGLDWAAGVLRVWESGHVVRMITGAVFGLMCGFLMARAAIALGIPPQSAGEAADVVPAGGGHVREV